MKDNALLKYGAILVGAIVLLVLLFNIPAQKEKAVVKEKTSGAEYVSRDWLDKYGLNNRKAKGLFIVNKLIQESGKFDSISEFNSALPFDSTAQFFNTTFAFIGDNFYLKEGEFDVLMAAVGKGADFFLSCNSFSENLYQALLEQADLNFFYEKDFNIAIDSINCQFWRVDEGDTVYGKWNTISNTAQSDLITILKSGEHNVYARLNYGAGNFYLHFNPELFLNYQLKRTEGFQHYLKTFGALEDDRLVWLNFGNYTPVKDDVGNTGNDSSLFGPLLKNKSFRWALFLFIFGLVSFLLFRSKRERPILEVKEDKQISPLSYVDTLAGIYFDRQKPLDALRMMRANFYLNIQKYFYVDLKKDGEKSIRLLSEKSGVPEEQIEMILGLLNPKKELSFADLKQVDKALRSFYFDTGIWKDKEKRLVDQAFYTVNRSLLLPMIVLVIGVLSIFGSLILLSNSIGYGVILWPVAILDIVLAYRMLTRPVLSYNKNELIVYALFKNKTSIDLDEVYHIKSTGVDLLLKVQGKEDIKVRIINSDKRDLSVLNKLVSLVNNKGNDRRE